MKKYTIMAAVLVLTISLMTGCGCTRRRDDMDTTPSMEETILPTIPDTIAPNVTEDSMPTMEPTETTGNSNETGTPNGSDSTTGMDSTDSATTPAARNRSNPMN